MARGWESKSVEDQLSAAEARRETKSEPALTELDLERQRRKKGLLLERVRLTRELADARHERHRELLRRSLEHVEAELAEFEA
jgi:hypothetical protein